MSVYVAEEFTAEEADILRRYFTNLYGPVFALVNLPEVVKGALFARYSRSAKSLRRLFLDEFVGELDITGDASIDATVGLRRAEDLYDKVFFEYGDDSVAQLGGVHLACEQASNLLTKVLEWGRLMAYLEQSTRYIAYDARLGGRYRFHRPPDVLQSTLGTRYVGDMDRMFDTYAELLPVVVDHLRDTVPKHPTDSDFVYRQAIRAKAFDALRGLLPAAALSNVGIYGTGQGYEQLLLRMRAHPLPEARTYADLMLTELRKVIPSFLKRVDLDDRGVAWSQYFASSRGQMEELAERLFPGGAGAAEPAPVVTLVDFDPDAEVKLVASALYPYLTCRRHRSRRGSARWAPRSACRSSVPTRGSGRTGATSPDGPSSDPPTASTSSPTTERSATSSAIGCSRSSGRRSRPITATPGPRPSRPQVSPDASTRSWSGRRRSTRHWSGTSGPSASYAVALAYKVRFVMQMNAREAMHLIELRTTPQGHPAYRLVGQEMHRLIAEEAGHSAIAEMLRFVDYSGEPELERLQAERRAEARRSGS